VHGYRNAITKLRSYPERITSWEQAKDINKIGHKSLLKIKEILETGTFTRVIAMEDNQRLKRLKLFKKIWGVGT